METEQTRAVNVAMAQAKRINILIIKVSKLFFFFVVVVFSKKK